MSSTQQDTNIDFDIKLVDLIRANPILYEKPVRSTPYDATKRKSMELWKSIATSLGVDAQYCIVRWKNLIERFRRELIKSRESQKSPAGVEGKTSTWPLLDKMRFIEHTGKYYGMFCKLHNMKTVQTSLNTSDTSLHSNMTEGYLFEDEDLLQEAMDEQSSEKLKEVATATPTDSATTSVEMAAPLNMKRIETLLEGLDTANRIKAEKRIVAYLCKCQLKSLNNESVDDIVI